MNNFSFLNFTTCKPTSQCCICLEKTKKSGYQCILCNRGFVCRNCIPQLCENGLCGKCPICRQENWRNIKINQTIVIPITQADVVIVESSVRKKEEEIISCCEQLPPYHIIMDRMSTICSILFISYILGVFTIGETVRLPYQKWGAAIHILALTIGSVDFAIISCCCYHALCKPRESSY